MRKAGLEKEGEFSAENITFKILRRNGYLKKLFDLKKRAVTKDLSLENVSMYDPVLAEGKGDVKDIIKRAKNAGILTLGLVTGLLAGDVVVQDLIASGVPQELIQQAQEFLSDSVAADIFKPRN
jgi:hypothetical protein